VRREVEERAVGEPLPCTFILGAATIQGICLALFLPAEVSLPIFIME
jgi:hypothetical protein